MALPTSAPPQAEYSLITCEIRGLLYPFLCPLVSDVGPVLIDIAVHRPGTGVFETYRCKLFDTQSRSAGFIESKGAMLSARRFSRVESERE
jgi:hypothetical protein